MPHHPITPEPSTHEHPPRVQGAQAPEEVLLNIYSDSVLISLSSPIDLPTLQARLDDPQFCRGGNHIHCERRRGLLYGRMTTCEASQNRARTANVRSLIVSNILYWILEWVMVRVRLDFELASHPRVDSFITCF